MTGLRFTFADGVTITKTTSGSMVEFLFRNYPRYVDEWINYENEAKRRWRNIEQLQRIAAAQY